MAIFGIILCSWLLAILASRLVRLLARSGLKEESVSNAHLKTVLGTTRSIEQLILSDLARAFLDTRRTRRKWIGSGKF